MQAGKYTGSTKGVEQHPPGEEQTCRKQGDGCVRVRQDPEDGVPVVRYRSGWTCSLPILRVPGPRQGDHYRQLTGPYRPSMPQMRPLVRRSGAGMPPVRLPGGTPGECRCSRVQHICSVSVPEMQSRVHAQDTIKHRWPLALTANRTPPTVRSHHGSCAGVYGAVKKKGRVTSRSSSCSCRSPARASAGRSRGRARRVSAAPQPRRWRTGRRARRERVRGRASR